MKTLWLYRVYRSRSPFCRIDTHYTFDAANHDLMPRLDNAGRLVFWLGGATFHNDFAFTGNRFSNFHASSLIAIATDF